MSVNICPSCEQTIRDQAVGYYARRPHLFLRPMVIWDFLNDHDMSQNQLARRLGISSSYMTQLMANRRAPSPALRARIRKLVGQRAFRRC